MKVDTDPITIIVSFGVLGLLYGIYNIIAVLSVTPKKIENKAADAEKDDEAKPLVQKEGNTRELTEEQCNKLVEISEKISSGANVFLKHEYTFLLFCIAIFATLIYFFAEHKKGWAYTTIAFVTGSLTSILCGLIGMKIATAANYRTAYKAYFGLGEAFRVAYHGGCVLGFVLVSISLLILVVLIMTFQYFMADTLKTEHGYRILFESIAGYGLGGSTVALFSRVGGGIYTKAADVGADLVAKLEYSMDEDSPKNPACIADNVGDNVGDIAGMGSDLFGSLAESTCAALLVASTSKELVSTGNYYYPLLLTSAGLIVCILTTLIAFATIHKIEKYDDLEMAIKLQLVISTILMIPCIVFLSHNYLPTSYSIGELNTITYKTNVTHLHTMICPISGLISGLLIGLITEYYTSMSFSPVKELITGCKQGAAINIILGLALGYTSNVLPTFLISGTIYISYHFAGMFGIALAALGMLGNLSICLAIDGYGPISDNAGGLATMTELPESIRDITDDLDSAGNTTAAIGKGFAIGSACLVAFSLYGAYVTRTNLSRVTLNSPIVFASILFGAMIPYLFSALTMKAVGNAATSMVREIRNDFEKNKDNWETYVPDPNNCIAIATDSSLSQMILPGFIVISTPIVTGVLLGHLAVAGLLVGIIITGIQLAISSANSGGAWDNCKKSIKKNGLPCNADEIRAEINRTKTKLDENQIESLNNILKELGDNPDNFYILKGKHFKIYKRSEAASIVGDTVGDPMKDTSGPSLNILIKLTSILSLVFGTLFVQTGFLLKI